MSLLIGKGIGVSGASYLQVNESTDTKQETDITSNLTSINTLNAKFPVIDANQSSIAYSKIISAPSTNLNIIYGDLTVGKLTNNHITDDTISYNKLDKTSGYSLLATDVNATNLIETKLTDNYIVDTSINLSKLNATNFGGVKYLRADGWKDVIFDWYQLTTINDTAVDNLTYQKLQTNANILQQLFYNSVSLKEIQFEYNFTNYTFTYFN